MVLYFIIEQNRMVNGVAQSRSARTLFPSWVEFNFRSVKPIF